MGDDMTRTFDEIFEFLMKWEGEKWEDDPDDDGNRGDGSPGNWGTKFGIDARSHPGVDIKNLTRQQAKEIYLSEYHKSIANTLPYPINFLTFDFTVNAGQSRAVKCLQRVAGVTPDGVWGPRTNEAWRALQASSKASRVPAMLLQCRRDFYNGLADGSRRLNRYRKGWINRTNDLGAFLDV